MVEIVKVKMKEAFPFHDLDRFGVEARVGDKVVTDCTRGMVVGTVLSRPLAFPDEEVPPTDGKVLRVATEQDLEVELRVQELEQEAYTFCLERIRERRLPMKLSIVEYLFDGSKAIFYFTADGRIDFRELVKDLARRFKTRIEMRQIGVRDEARMVGGLGSCGLPLCCSSFLKDFAPVSIKMAKDQDLALNLEKISGACGRVVCCLVFEQPVYLELKKDFPKCGKRVVTDEGVGKVMKHKVFEGLLTIKLPDGRLVDFRPDQVKTT